jgi:hypothetical protein
MVSLKGSVHLQSSLDALNEAEEQRKRQDKNSNPECIPLHSISSIMPPLAEILWGCFIENLLEHNQAVAPVHELLDLAIVGLEVTA